MSTQRARDLMAQINTAMKAPVLKMANDDNLKVTYLPTGVLPIDALTGGGIPRGRFVTITGDWSTLKSYVGLRAIATTQAGGGVCALIDTEHAFDPQWATDLGVDVDALILQHPESGELAIDTAEALVRAGVDLIVFDSVAAALPEAERSKRLFDEQVQPARIAQLMSVAMRKLTAANTNTSIIWINQLRMQIGVTFGNPEIATGGKALPYYSSMIINIRKTGKVTRGVKTWDGTEWKDTKETYAQKFRAYMEKSKLSAPHREVHFVWDYEQNSVDEAGYLIAVGLENGIITREGKAGWKFGKVKVQGREKFHQRVAKDRELQAEIRQALAPWISPGSPAADSPKDE